MSTQDVEEMQRALGRIEGQLGGIDGKLDSHLVIAQDHEKRISALERWKYGLVLLCTVGGGVVGTIIKLAR